MCSIDFIGSIDSIDTKLTGVSVYFIYSLPIDSICRLNVYLVNRLYWSIGRLLGQLTVLTPDSSIMSISFIQFLRGVTLLVYCVSLWSIDSIGLLGVYSVY